MIATRPRSGIVYDDSVRDMDRWLVANPQVLHEEGLPPVTSKMLRYLRDHAAPLFDPAWTDDEIVAEIERCDENHAAYMELVKIYRDHGQRVDDEEPARSDWSIVIALLADPWRALGGGALFAVGLVAGLGALAMLLSAVTGGR